MNEDFPRCGTCVLWVGDPHQGHCVLKDALSGPYHACDEYDDDGRTPMHIPQEPK